MKKSGMQIEWTNIRSNSGAKCRSGIRYEQHPIKKGQKAIVINGDDPGRDFKFFLCEKHGIQFLEDCQSLMDKWQLEPKAPWNQPTEDGEFPGDICCMRATGGRCYEHDYRNYRGDNND